MNTQYTQEEFESGIVDIETEIKRSGFAPTRIIAIPRGGLVPATYLSHRLDIPLDVYQTCSVYKPEDKILIVDEIIDEGTTMKNVLDFFEANFPDVERKVACLIFNTKSAENIDKLDINNDLFYHISINRNYDTNWYVFPWE